ncbi:MAG: T9SS type A sorting domain-containing protein [Bacteroidia bacterium]|nr:T9SS type A sorting domain-containing protein [Bacteroidia bacterium]
MKKDIYKLLRHCAILAFLMLLSSSQIRIFAQGGKLAFTVTNPSNLGVCGPSATFSLSVKNNAATATANNLVKVWLPNGVSYNVTSVSGSGVTESDVSQLNRPIFDFGTINSKQTKTITFTVNANCDFMYYLDNDITTALGLRADYTGNYDSTIASPFTGLAPALVFYSFVNQSYSGNVGNTFVRTIVIKNSGDGKLSNFNLYDRHQSGISVLGMTPGVATTNGDTSFLALGPAEFAGIGNSDGFFDPNETITISETLRIDACTNLQSALKLYWGCDGNVCDIQSQTGNATIALGTPNITYTATAINNVCYGTYPSLQTLKFVNTGTEVARNLELYVYQSTGSSFYNGFYSRIDTTSIQIKYGTGAYTTIPLTSTKKNLVRACFGGADPTGAFTINVPLLPKGDSIVVQFSIVTCCPTTCSGEWGGAGFSGSRFGWKYSLTYQNQCLTNNFSTGQQSGSSGYYSMYLNTQDISGPSDLGSGEIGSYSIVNSGHDSWPRQNNRGYLKFVFTLPAGISFPGGAGDLVFQDASGVTTWAPASITNVAGIVTAIYRFRAGGSLGSPFSSFEKSELKINLKGECGTGGIQNVGLTTYYNANDTCSCDIPIRCNSFNIKVHCPVPCPGGGVAPTRFSMLRVSYGSPDSLNNGTANGTMIDTTKIKQERVVYGDTIRIFNSGTVITTVANPDWNYLFNRVYIPQGRSSRMDIRHISAYLTIYDASTGVTHQCTLGAPTVQNGTNAEPHFRILSYNMTATTLTAIPALPVGFRFENGDGLWFTAYVKPYANNSSGNLAPVTIQDTFFTSTANAPQALTNRYFCDNFNANMTFITYYYTTWGPQTFNFRQCNLTAIDQRYYFAVGPCCNNYAGGNMFPFEYRQFTKLRQFKVLMPPGFSFVSATLEEIRSNGTNKSVSSGVRAIAPVDPNSNPLVFDPAGYYSFPGTKLSDEGFYGQFIINLRPTCNASTAINQPIVYTQSFDQSSGRLAGSPTADSIVSTPASSGDYLEYASPSLQITSPLPTKIATTDSISWDFSVENISNEGASNTWFTFVNNSGGMTIRKVIDLATNTEVLPTSSIYRIGVLSGNTAKSYRVIASFTNCLRDTFIIHTGWNCTGYPLTLASYPCTTQTILLRYTSSKPVIATSSITPVTAVNLCDTLDFEFRMNNTSVSIGYSPTLTIKRPNGMTIVPNSAYIEYPIGSGWRAIPDPKSIGLNYQWLVDTLDTTIGSVGLKGATFPAENAYRIKCKMVTSCSYVSGSYIRITNRIKAGCGINFLFYYTTPIITIFGVPNDYTTVIKTQMDTIRSCVSPAKIRFTMINQGPGKTNTTDKIFIILPSSITYSANSTTGLYNPPTIIEPTLTVQGGDVRLEWVLPANVEVGDSVSLEFYVDGDTSLVSGSEDIDFQTAIQDTLPCGLSSCLINALTGSSTKPIIIDRPTGLWTGQSDEDWFNPFNWGDCKVPTCAVDVTIPNVPNKPVVPIYDIAETKNLTIESGSYIILKEDAQMNICGNLWIKSSGNYDSKTNSNVHFTGTSPQVYTKDGTASFENVYMDQATPSTLTLNNNLDISKSLTLNSGVIITNSNRVYVSNGDSAAVNTGNLNSYVQGNLRRNVSSTGLFNLPVGHFAQGYELAQLNFTSIGGLTAVDARFDTWIGLPSPINQWECAALFDKNFLDHGYWTIDATNGGAAPNYDAFLYNRGASNYLGAGLTIVKRPTGSGSGFSITDGTCDPASTITKCIRRNLSTFSEFGIEQSNQVLPVSLTNFVANPLQSTIELRWETFAESNLKTYIVERSTDRLNFKDIADIPAKGSSLENVYRLEDKQVITNIRYYYRLKIQEIDGTEHYSNVVEAILPIQNQFSAEVYPNPSNGNFSIVAQVIELGQYEIAVIDILGQTVYHQNYNWEAGSNQVKFSLGMLPQGSYILKIKGQSGEITQRISIQPK